MVEDHRPAGPSIEGAEGPRSASPDAPGALPPVGDVGREGLRALKRAGKSVTTPDLAAAIAAARGRRFANRQDRDDFALSVTMAICHCEQEGAVAFEKAPSRLTRGLRTTAGRLLEPVSA